MVYSWAFARHTKLLDVVCSIPALSAAARQAGQASTSQIHFCSIRTLSLPLAGHQECRTFHGSTRPHRGMQGGRDCLESTERCESRRLFERIQRRTAFGLPNLNGDPSKKYHERRLIGYSQEQLYAVVAGVEHYKEFVPWCQRSDIVDRKPPGFVEAELEVGFKMFVERYTSQVHLSPPAQVISRVFDSTLFDHLDSTWDFKPGPTPESTWLSFTVDFAFKSPLYHHIASVFFDEVVKRMMGAFEGRCQQLYGTSAFRKAQQQKQKLQTA